MHGLVRPRVLAEGDAVEQRAHHELDQARDLFQPQWCAIVSRETQREHGACTTVATIETMGDWFAAGG